MQFELFKQLQEQQERFFNRMFDREQQQQKQSPIATPKDVKDQVTSTAENELGMNDDGEQEEDDGEEMNSKKEREGEEEEKEDERSSISTAQQ